MSDAKDDWINTTPNWWSEIATDTPSIRAIMRAIGPMHASWHAPGGPFADVFRQLDGFGKGRIGLFAMPAHGATFDREAYRFDVVALLEAEPVKRAATEAVDRSRREAASAA